MVTIVIAETATTDCQPYNSKFKDSPIFVVYEKTAKTKTLPTLLELETASVWFFNIYVYFFLNIKKHYLLRVNSHSFVFKKLTKLLKINTCKARRGAVREKKAP